MLADVIKQAHVECDETDAGNLGELACLKGGSLVRKERLLSPFFS